MVTTSENSIRFQSAPVVLVLEEQSSLGLRHVRLRDRVRARTQSTRLDEQLAAGMSPESNVLLALHAARLYRPMQRRRLAVSLRAVALAARRSRRMTAPINRRGVGLVQNELEAVATRLDANGPIDVSGVARVRRLLADGAGPLYMRSTPERLRQELASALAALDPSQ
jgi:hypothetical protein